MGEVPGVGVEPVSTRVQEQNVNTAAYWDTAYYSEALAGSDRLFGKRLDHVMRWVGLRASEVSPLSFLDVGCGLGDLAKRVCEDFPDAVPSGVDISGIAIKYAEGRFPSGVFRRADVDHDGLPFQRASFDFVWCGELLEHVDDPEAVVVAIRRVTKPGGIIVLSTPYKNRISGPEHVWSHAGEDMLRWALIAGSEMLFFSYDVLQDDTSTMMLMALRR